MNITFANTYDSRGGAARAAFRLFQGVARLSGVSASMVVHENATGAAGVEAIHSDCSVQDASDRDNCSLKTAHPDRVKVPFSVNRFSGTTARAVGRTSPDLVHLHWLHCGFLSIEDLAALGRPLVWTIHDMWALTGVCHYSGGCRRYLKGCGACPLLRSRAAEDISAQTYRRKAAVYPDLDLTIVSPSRWLAGLAMESPLLGSFRVEVIPNGIDTSVFAPVEKHMARNLLGLPWDKTILLFGADWAMDDPRKGAAMLMDALASGPIPGVEIAIFGCDPPVRPTTLSMKIHWLGKINDDHRLIAAYSSADLFVAPSLEENLANTVMESLACGTPVLAFDIGGMKDMIRSGKNGFLVPEKEGAEGLRRRLDSVFLNPEILKHAGKKARDSVLRNFRLDKIAARYGAVYDSLLTK